MIYKQHVLGRDEIGAALEHVCAIIKAQKSLSERTESVWDGERDIKVGFGGSAWQTTARG
jgi:hypothetical protein